MRRASDTDWRRIAELYAQLLAVHPSPVVELNRAVAVAMAEGPDRGLELIAVLEERGELEGYHHLPATKADMLRRLGRYEAAAPAYRAAIALAGNGTDRDYLSARLAECAH